MTSAETSTDVNAAALMRISMSRMGIPGLAISIVFLASGCGSPGPVRTSTLVDAKYDVLALAGPDAIMATRPDLSDKEKDENWHRYRWDGIWWERYNQPRMNQEFPAIEEACRKAAAKLFPGETKFVGVKKHGALWVLTIVVDTPKKVFIRQMRIDVWYSTLEGRVVAVSTPE